MGGSSALRSPADGPIRATDASRKHYRSPPRRTSKNVRHKRALSLLVNPDEAAKAASLRYVTAARPGIRRKGAGKGFSYIDADGRVVRERDTLRRIRSLAIPPAWRDVWICPLPNG